MLEGNGGGAPAIGALEPSTGPGVAVPDPVATFSDVALLTGVVAVELGSDEVPNRSEAASENKNQGSQALIYKYMQNIL